METFQRALVWIFGEDGDVLMASKTQALLVASSVLVTGVMLLSPLIVDLADVFAVSETRSGWLIIMFTGAGAVTLPLVGLFGDFLGRKRLLVVGLLVFGITGAAVGFTSRFDVALLLRAFQGVGFAAAAPIILALFGDLYNGSEETTVQGIRVSVNSLVNTVIPVLAGALFVYSWRYPFMIYLIAVPSALWVWAAVPTVQADNDLSLRVYLSEITTFLNDIPIALLMISFFFRFFLYYGMLTYISVLAVQEAGLAVVAVGALLSIRGAIKTVSSTQVGRLSLSIPPEILALGGFALIGSATAVMGILPTTAILIVAITVWGIGDGILSPCQKSLVNQFSPPEYRGGVMSTALTCQNVGKVVGPAVFGVLLGMVGPASAFVLVGVIGGAFGTGALLGMIALQNS